MGDLTFKLDLNQLFNDAAHAVGTGTGAIVVFALVILVMSPLLIPAVSKALKEHRELSHQRERELAKIRNAVVDHAPKLSRRLLPRGGAQPRIGTTRSAKDEH